jgi:glycosyltransferase involved in cell wall biosynthesis
LSGSHRKVLFLTASYPTPEHALLGTFVKEHARAVALHYDVAVAHLDRRDGVKGVLELAPARDEEFPTVRASYPRAPAPVSYAANMLAAGAALRALRRRGFSPDVIHAHFFLAGVPAVVLGRILRKPVVLTEQWSIFLPSDPGTLSPSMQRIARFAFERADLVLPVSEALRDGIEAIGAKARFRVVPNVVDLDRFELGAAHPATNERPHRLIGVGGLYEPKGWEFLLEAIAIRARERRDFHLDIVGDGDLRAQYEELARQLEIEDLVSFHGWVSKDEVARRLLEADLFVLTSRYDSNPCAMLEALACGVPVVGTAVGGIPEIVGDGMGLLAKAEDPPSIAAQIDAALASDAWDHDRIARTARARYGAEHIGRELAAVYDEVLARKR